MDRAMKREIALLSAVLLLPALLWSAEPGRCQLTKGLYEDRLTLLQKQGPTDSSSAGALLAAGTASPATRLAAMDGEYRQFFAELTTAMQSNNNAALQS